MSYINLTNGGSVRVDSEDLDFLNQWNWERNSYGYAIRRVRHGKLKREIIWMHRLLNNTPKGLDTDHINRIRLDNRKQNLRTVTRGKNLQNTSIRKINTSGHKGVSWHKRDKKWRSFIGLNGKYIHLGVYENIKTALLARKKAEQKYFTC